YEYMALPTTRHITLLLLYPRHPKGPVKCSLIPVLLDHAPSFDAISYTWASPDKEFYVHVNDNVIPVTANTYNALRDRSSYLFPRLLWIDSICINQENPSEKTDQIRLMGEICSNASLVTIWL
ncbi:HET-domain-containing protein, partial [Hyaloscypha hepaticicola]